MQLIICSKSDGIPVQSLGTWSGLLFCKVNVVYALCFNLGVQPVSAKATYSASTEVLWLLFVAISVFKRSISVFNRKYIKILPHIIFIIVTLCHFKNVSDCPYLK